MSDVITKQVTARKRWTCERCVGPILPGTLHERHAAPPNGELGNIGWWVLRSHLTDTCPDGGGR